MASGLFCLSLHIFPGHKVAPLRMLAFTSLACENVFVLLFFLILHDSSLYIYLESYYNEDFFMGRLLIF